MADADTKGTFPSADRNRLISNASKALLEQMIPASWHLTHISGDSDFGLDVLVQLDVDGGVQHNFTVQLKGTESPTFIQSGTTLSYPLKRTTQNYYANMVQEVMLVVAVVKLDETGKLISAESQILWQWMSVHLERLRGSAFAVDVSEIVQNVVHIPTVQRLHPRLDVLPHLEARLSIARAGVGIDELLRREVDSKPDDGGSMLARLAAAAEARPAAIVALLQHDRVEPTTAIPEKAQEIRTLLRAGNTAEAEAALDLLGPGGFGAGQRLAGVLLSLRGRVAMQRGRREEALDHFRKAYAAEPSEDHLLALTETRFLIALDADDQVEIGAAADSLEAATSDEALALRVRVFCSQRRFEDAAACLARMDAKKQFVSEMVLLASRQQWSEVVNLADKYLLDPTLTTADRVAVTLIAARAAWWFATAHVVQGTEGSVTPLSGAVGTDIDFARRSWQLAMDCMNSLRILGWGPNVELIAPFICASAGALGCQREGLLILGEAAARRPEYAELQRSVELLAIGVGDPEVALAANSKQLASGETLLRRVAILFQLKRFAECLAAALQVARDDSEPEVHTPVALATGLAAANKLGKSSEAAELRRRLSQRPEWDEFLQFAEFGRLAAFNPNGDQALAPLRAGLRAHPESWLLGANLFSNLDASDPEQAREIVALSRSLRRKSLFSRGEMVHLVAALVTLEQWAEVSFEAAQALERFGTDERLLAMAAAAQEMLGHTAAALKMLEEAMSVGTNRVSVAHNYMAIALRLGRMDSVRAAVDKLLELISDREERLELLRLSALVHIHQDHPDQAHDTAWEVGQLVDRFVEQEEGLFLNLVMATTIQHPLSDERKAEFAGRIDAFCTQWPQSNLFRLVSLPDRGSFSLDDLHQLLDPIVGDSRARLEAFEKRERQARAGELPVPFIMRPGFVLHYVGDPFTLWEVAKRSKAEDQQLHLGLVYPNPEAKSPDPTRDIPLLDLSTLLVLDSLDLFDKLFAVFVRIAVSRSTVAYIGQQAHGVLSHGIGSVTARSILARINHWLDRIDQPAAERVTERKVTGPREVFQEYIKLVQRRTWVGYCDDALSRAVIHGEDSAVATMNTVDFLSTLDYKGLVSPFEVATALEQLAIWHVSISVDARYLIASLKDALPDEFTGDASRRADLFQSHTPFITLARAIWHPAKTPSDLIAHMDLLLQAMLRPPSTDVDSAAAVLACWFTRVRLMTPAGALAWRLICYPALAAISQLDERLCGRVVSVLQRAVAAVVGERMTVDIEVDVAKQLGSVAGSLANRNVTLGGSLLKKLHTAMLPGTIYGDGLMRGYIEALRESDRAE